MFFNITNHPSDKWSAEQTAAANNMAGEIKDLAFPIIPPEASSEEVDAIADGIVSEVYDIISKRAENAVVHVMGEMVCTFDIVSKLQTIGISCVASTSQRDVVLEKDKEGNEIKVVKFKFVQFREY